MYLLNLLLLLIKQGKEKLLVNNIKRKSIIAIQLYSAKLKHFSYPTVFFFLIFPLKDFENNDYLKFEFLSDI